jgi:hypothetical protein
MRARRQASPAASAVFLSALLLAAPASGAPIAVRHPEGAARGFLALQSRAGAHLADGEVTQTVRDGVVDSRITFRFKDGSLYEEGVTFSQRQVFRLLTYRVRQRGPAFLQDMEVTLERRTGRYKGRFRPRPDGPDQIQEARLDMPDDLYNGMSSTLLRNLPAGVTARVHLVAFTPAPRLIEMALIPAGEDRFLVGDQSLRATRYHLKLEVGGVSGVVASILGKDPPDLYCWMTGGPVPGFVKFEGAFYLKGPVWRIELASPRWPVSDRPRSGAAPRPRGP